MKSYQIHRFTVAPMMDWTDRHCRFFHRLLTRRTLLYSEMITTGAVIHGNRSRLLASDPAEQPVALQLGGCDPRALAECAAIGEGFGFAEINLNVGCPSDRVPVAVKCRIGIDEQDPEEALDALTAAVERAGVDALIVHARKAWLKGLSPRQNRDVPPLDYARVYRLKAAHPRLPIVLNGGVLSVEAAAEHLKNLDGVMMGRAAYQEPWRLLAVDAQLFGEASPAPDAKSAARALIPYIERELARGVRLHAITRHVLGLFRGVPGARAFRRHLATEAVKASADVETFCDALALIETGQAAPGAVDTVAA